MRTQRKSLVGAVLLTFAAACAAGLETPAENEWARVTEVALRRLPLEGSPGRFAVSYTFALEPKRSDIERVDIVDLSTPDPTFLVREGQVGGDNAWSSEQLALSPEVVPWLFYSGPTRKIFRFTLYSKSGETSVLEQRVVYSAATKAYYRGPVKR